MTRAGFPPWKRPPGPAVRLCDADSAGSTCEAPVSPQVPSLWEGQFSRGNRTCAGPQSTADPTRSQPAPVVGSCLVPARPRRIGNGVRHAINEWEARPDGTQLLRVAGVFARLFPVVRESRPVGHRPDTCPPGRNSAAAAEPRSLPETSETRLLRFGTRTTVPPTGALAVP